MTISVITSSDCGPQVFNRSYEMDKTVSKNDMHI
jgi:hypothetical protein